MSPLCRWLLKNRLRLAEVLLKKAVDGEIVFLPGHVVRDILIQRVFSKSPALFSASRGMLKTSRADVVL